MRVVAIVLAAALCVCVVRAALPNAKWRGVDWVKAEKDLEEGDEAELLVTEDKIAIAEYDRRRSLGLRKPEDDVQLKDSQEWLRHSQAMTGPAMMFVTLNKAQKDGTYWSKKAVGKLAGEWRDLIKTAALDAQVYDITVDGGAPTSDTFTLTPTVTGTPIPTPEPAGARLLVSMHNGWRGYELRDFILRRPEVAELEWDQVKLTPADLDADGNFIGGISSDKAEAPAALMEALGGGGAFAMPPGAPASAKAGAAKVVAKAKKGEAAAKKAAAAAAAARAAAEDAEDAVDWKDEPAASKEL